jgi:hypothetical protein
MAEQASRAPIDLTKLVPLELRDKPRELVDFLASRLFDGQTSSSDTFVQYLEARKPDTSDATMRGLLHLMTSTPEFQLI